MRETGFRPSATLTVLRCDHAHEQDDVPCAITFLTDGTTRIIWPVQGRDEHITAIHAPDGTLSSLQDPSGAEVDPRVLSPSVSCRMMALSLFENGLLKQHGLHSFIHDPNEHRLEMGSGDTIIVRNKASGRISNSNDQPAIIPMPGAGEPVFMVNGSVFNPGL